MAHIHYNTSMLIVYFHMEYKWKLMWLVKFSHLSYYLRIWCTAFSWKAETLIYSNIIIWARELYLHTMLIHFQEFVLFFTVGGICLICKFVVSALFSVIAYVFLLKQIFSLSLLSDVNTSHCFLNNKVMTRPLSTSLCKATKINSHLKLI